MNRPMSFALAASLCCAPLGPAGAHPHIFIDTAFALVFDADGVLSAVRIDWAYDEFYSLLMLEENELDADGDGVPEQDRLDAYAGQDVDWAAGFPGDFSVEKDGETVTLERPVQHAVRYSEGRIVTSHVRPLAEPFAVDGTTVVVRSYDPTFFVAYDVPTEPTVSGRDGCTLERDAADLDEAYRIAGDKLAEVDVNEDPFEVVDRDDIGILFADAFLLTCAAPS